MSDPVRYLIWSTRNPINVRNFTFALTDKFKLSVCDCETTSMCKGCRLENVHLYYKSFGNRKRYSSADFGKSSKLVAHTL